MNRYGNQRPAKRDDGFPTRADIRYDTDAERLCRILLKLVEGMGADVSLTNAVVHIDAARNCIADFVEGAAVPVVSARVSESKLAAIFRRRGRAAFRVMRSPERTIKRHRRVDQPDARAAAAIVDLMMLDAELRGRGPVVEPGEDKR